MADYYPLIARAITGLDKSTGEARRALYERARTALVEQLRGVEPALSEADITRERLALEEAIRKVEAEAARRPRDEAPETPREAAAPLARFDKPSSFAPPPPPPPPEVHVEQAPPPPDWEELQRELDGLAPPPQPETGDGADDHARENAADAQDEDAPSPQTGLDPGEPPLPLEMEPARPEPQAESDKPEPETLPPEPARRRFSAAGTSLVDEGLKGFRDVMAETDDLGGATASASKSARATREAFAGLPPAGEAERIEPRVEPRMEPRFGDDDLKRPEPDFSPEPPNRRELRAGARRRAAEPPPPPLGLEQFDEPEEQRLRSGMGGGLRKIVALGVVLVLAVAAFFAYGQWSDDIAGMFQTARVPATQASKESPQARPKISDRIGGAQQDSSARPAAGSGAAVAQRAVLYEQQPNQGRKQYVGSVIWKTETASPGPGQPPDIAVKGEVEIPERQLRMSITVRRNLDKSLPASHTLEILFSVPADFDAGGIADVPGVLLEDSDQRRGMPLTGTRVKVTNGFFLVGLSSVESDVRRNVQLLKDRAWLHIRMAYNNGTPGLLAIEKGVPGDRVFEEALTAWGQNPPTQDSQR